MERQKLQTSFTKLMNREKPWQDYPRPQLKRDSYYNLNGLWDYRITTSTTLPTEYQGKILVPFPLESSLSGVELRLAETEYLFYHTTFRLPSNFKKDIVFLHFGAVDQEAVVYLNKVEIGRHQGGYHPFSFDITRYLLSGENELIVRVKDALDTKYPYVNKAKTKGMWYTPVSGIWQTVWLESVRQGYIEELKITPNIDEKQSHLTLKQKQKRLLFKYSMIINR